MFPYKENNTSFHEGLICQYVAGVGEKFEGWLDQDNTDLVIYKYSVTSYRWHLPSSNLLSGM